MILFESKKVEIQWVKKGVKVEKVKVKNYDFEANTWNVIIRASSLIGQGMSVQFSTDSQSSSFYGRKRWKA